MGAASIRHLAGAIKLDKMPCGDILSMHNRDYGKVPLSAFLAGRRPPLREASFPSNLSRHKVMFKPRYQEA